MYAVIRKCCLGPNCSYNHGATKYVRGVHQDPRLSVVQYATTDEAKGRKVTANWDAYDARLVEVTEDLFDMLEPRSAGWLRERIAFEGAQAKVNVGAGI